MSRPVVTFRQEGDQWIAQLPVLDGNGHMVRAEMLQSDLQQLRWLHAPVETAYLISGNVFVTLFGHRKAALARLILGLGAGKRVRYRNGDPLCLLRSNLQVVKGKAKHDDRNILRTSLVEWHQKDMMRDKRRVMRS